MSTALDSFSSSRTKAVGHRGVAEQMPKITSYISKTGVAEEEMGQSMLNIERAKLAELSLSSQKEKSAADVSHMAATGEADKCAIKWFPLSMHPPLLLFRLCWSTTQPLSANTSVGRAMPWRKRNAPRMFARMPTQTCQMYNITLYWSNHAFRHFP